jgi:hypothetical protein
MGYSTGSADTLIRWNGSGHVFHNDSANSKATVGLTINQLCNDNEIQAWKSSDITTGLTTLPATYAGAGSETDTWGSVTKGHATLGGTMLQTFAAGVSNSFHVVAFSSSQNTCKSTGAVGTIRLDAYKHNGSNANAAFTANSNLLSIGGIDNGTAVRRFLFDIEGSAHADVEWIAFDDYCDIELLRGVHGALTPDYKTTFGQDMMYNLSSYEDLGLVGKCSVHWEDRPDGRHQLRGMVNTTGLTMLHHSTILQMNDRLNDRINVLENQLKALSEGK